MLIRVYLSVRSAILTIAAIVGVVSIVAFAAAAVFSVRPLIVISGSMAPGIPTGSLLFAADRSVDDISVGDIVTVDRPDGSGLITHRVASIDEADGARSLHLQGDANSIPDPAPYSQAIVGKYLFSIPGAGDVAAFFQNLQGLLIGGAALLGLVALTLFEPKRRSGGAGSSPRVGSADTTESSRRSAAPAGGNA